jgi:IMP dehydrogenase/GMP reductase
MKKTLTYDDVNIVPKYSELESRGDVKLNTRFTKNTELTIPIVSSPMDTVTGYEMAKEMMDWGGVGVLHRFNTIEEQSKMMKSLHREWDRYFDGVPGITDGEERTIEKEWKEWWDSVKHWNSPPTKSDWDDLKERFWFADSMIRDEKIWSRRPLCAAVGVKGDYLERAQELVNNGCNVLFIDIAHGHHKLMSNAISKLKGENNVEVVAGSVATAEGVRFLCEQGADSVRIGVGNGSLCETRIRTGVGVPQVSALLDAVAVADNYNTPVIADGGVRTIGDVCKGLGCGADTIMLGSLLSGTKESPGEIEKVGEWPNEQLFKKYRGSASRDSKGNDKNVEGNHKIIPYKGKVKRILHDIRDGINSSCSYVGASNISEYHSKVEFVEVSRAGQIEASPHLLKN